MILKCQPFNQQCIKSNTVTEFVIPWHKFLSCCAELPQHILSKWISWCCTLKKSTLHRLTGWICWWGRPL